MVCSHLDGAQPVEEANPSHAHSWQQGNMVEQAHYLVL